MKGKIIYITRNVEGGGEITFLNKLIEGVKQTFDVKRVACIGGSGKKNVVLLKPYIFLNLFFPSVLDYKLMKREVDLQKENVLVQHFIFDVRSFFYFFYAYSCVKNNIITFHTQLNNVLVLKNIFNKLSKIILLNSVIFFAKKLIFLTSAQKLYFRRDCLFKKEFDRKSTVINNFIEDKYILKKSKSDLGEQKIIFVGSAKKTKGFEDIVDLSEQMSNENFLILTEKEISKKISRERNLEVVIGVENEDIFSYYDSAQIFILPSYTEVFPMTILEAMARGLVILVSDIPGMREIVEAGRNGYLFPPGDIEKMREQVLYLRNNPKEIERISKNNLKDIQKFAKKDKIAEYVKIYKELLN